MKKSFKSDTLESARLTHSAARTKDQKRLTEFIAANSDRLLNTLAMYVRQSDLAQGSAAKQIALELLSELTIEALTHAERFDPSRPAMAWLLGIGANLIKRRQVARAIQSRRGGLARDMDRVREGEAGLSDDEIFDRFAELNLTKRYVDNPEDIVVMNDETARLLAPLTVDDRRVLYLAQVHELNSEELAQDLGTTAGAARVRLTRALNRLRQIWNGSETAKRDE